MNLIKDMGLESNELLINYFLTVLLQVYSSVELVQTQNNHPCQTTHNESNSMEVVHEMITLTHNDTVVQ